MNIHPLFVHFPIALLTLYAVLEIASCFFPKAWKKGDTLLTIKTFLIMAGGLSLLPTLGSGEMASELIVIGSTPLIEKHELFAKITTLIFALLAAGHTLWLFDSLGWSEKLQSMHKSIAILFTFGRKIADIVMHPVARPIIAMAGLIAITITGALGASIVYGVDIDPFVTFIFNLVI